MLQITYGFDAFTQAHGGCPLSGSLGQLLSISSVDWCLNDNQKHPDFMKFDLSTILVHSLYLFEGKPKTY
jgi:hypothetical protein